MLKLSSVTSPNDWGDKYNENKMIIIFSDEILVTIVSNTLANSLQFLNILKLNSDFRRRDFHGLLITVQILYTFPNHTGQKKKT